MSIVLLSWHLITLSSLKEKGAKLLVAERSLGCKV